MAVATLEKVVVAPRLSVGLLAFMAIAVLYGLR
jgi:hypothetical protein